MSINISKNKCCEQFRLHLIDKQNEIISLKVMVKSLKEELETLKKQKYFASNQTF
jgi:hypothetical protein